ncbi:hypothetical protein DYB32_010679, partial [Aphanomyces invadans]
MTNTTVETSRPAKPTKAPATKHSQHCKPAHVQHHGNKQRVAFDKHRTSHKRKTPASSHPPPAVIKKPKKDAPDTVKLNKELAQFASRKQLPEAQAVFENAVAKRLANSYTYVNMMNVCVRCGNLPQAATVFESMKAAKIAPDVVAYTTLIKGLCGEGRLTDAMQHVRAMERAKVPLNIRTVNTLLRGCILIGDVSTAESILDATLG